LDACRLWGCGPDAARHRQLNEIDMTMKTLKTLLVTVCALAVLAGPAANLYADCGQCPAGKTEQTAGCTKKCCEEAKKAGKTCEKCAAKNDKKDDKK
jgi:hypothetical protein